MQIVIDIPEELYEGYKGRPPMLGDAGMDMIAQAIANGTPLPQGHGRLIDVDKIIFNSADFDVYNDYSFAFDALDYAPTIIEAESEDKE